MDNINTAGDMTAFVNDLSYLVHRTTVESFSDDFSGVSLNSAWSPTGSYSVVGNTLNGTNAAGYLTAARTNTAPDSQLKVSVNKTSALNSIRLYTRDMDSNHKVWVEIWGTAMQIIERAGGVNTTLDSASITTNLNTWYDYHVVTDGNRVEVWRGPQGGTTELILETDTCTVPASTRFTLNSWTCTAGYDNIEFITNGPATQTMAYNGANELTSSTVGAITTTYTYDDWGRTISKADGTHSARYIWFAGDKLKQYESDFPSEADVAFQYDGLGKRRLKLVNISAPSDADYTWYRWDAGWNMIGEYAAGTDAGTTWDVGALERWYQGKAAHADGDPDTAAHNYNLRDHIGTVRTVYSQSQTLLARFEALPFGTSNFSTGLGLNFGFSGMQWDQELLAYFTPFRYMEPANPRWLSKDPIGMVDGPNLYNYVGGAPVNRIDTLGLDWTLWDFANWFFNGEGQPVDFSNIGLLDDYRADDQVVSSVAILKIRLTMRARTLAQQLLASCDGPGTKSGAVSYGTFFHLEFSLSMGALGVLGHHILFGSGRCRVTVDCCTKAVTRKCSANFSVNDMYTRPLGPIINDVGGTPYELHINWSEDF